MRACARILGLAASLLLAAPAPAQPSPDEEPPRELGLTERAGTRLAQIDVTVTGPTAVVADLEPADFKVKVNLTRIRAFILDRFCSPPEPQPTPESSTAIVPGAPPTYLFYFDQPLLTLQGRQRAMTLTRELLETLIHDDAQAMVISNASKLQVVEPLTSDRERLLEAIKRLENDRTQFDTWATQEDYRISEVVRTPNDNRESGSVERAMGMARRFQMEETWRAEKSMRRLSMTLARLSEARPPKAVLYFADIMRANAGEHWQSFFGQRLRDTSTALVSIATDAWMARSPFDRITHEASALGVRFYPVLAQGLESLTDNAMASASAYERSGGNPSTSRLRHQHARNSLANLATETGGYAFLQGQGASKVAERLEQDFSCLYLISFDPGEFAEDSALRIVVEPRRSDVRFRVRGQLVVQSDSARTTARLLNAFAAPEGEGHGEDFVVRAGLVPTGFRDGRYDALLQISVPALPLQGATWDLGASVLTRELVRDETSGRISVPYPGVPVIFETELTFKPGDYEIVAVAHETGSGLLESTEVEYTWPDPGKQSASITPIAVLQPETGAFMRSEASRTVGSLARGASEPLRAERATALIGLVCRGRKRRGPLQVQRTLIGETAVEFPPLELELAEGPCAQVRDLVPANTLGEGYYRYEISVREGEQTLHHAARDFLVVAGPR